MYSLAKCSHYLFLFEGASSNLAGVSCFCYLFLLLSSLRVLETDFWPVNLNMVEACFCSYLVSNNQPPRVRTEFILLTGYFGREIYVLRIPCSKFKLAKSLSQGLGAKIEAKIDSKKTRDASKIRTCALKEEQIMRTFRQRVFISVAVDRLAIASTACHEYYFYFKWLLLGTCLYPLQFLDSFEVYSLRMKYQYPGIALISMELV